MKQIKALLLLLATSASALAADITLKPGQLQGLLDKMTDESSLKISGTMDARDIAALEKMPASVTVLDLSDVKIASLTTSSRQYFGRTLFNEGEIPAYSFFKSGVETIILPKELSVIGDGAFAGSSITSITIPEGVTSLGDYAFYGCISLETAKLPKSVAAIGKGAFENCSSLSGIDLSSTSVAAIPEKCFAGCQNLTELNIPGSTTFIGREAFSHSGIKELNLGNVEAFDSYALSGMQDLKYLTINPESKIGDGMLMDNTHLASVEGVPERVPDYFAANCIELMTETLKNAFELGKYSFANTKAPETLFLPAYITKIERGALSGLSTITKIDVTALENNIPEVDATSFEGLSQQDIVLWVDDNSFEAWEAHPVWRLFQIMSNSQTGVDEMEADIDSSDISIRCAGGLLIVESPYNIIDLRVFTTDGRMAYVATPGQTRVEIETTGLPSGVAIVTASDEKGNTKTISLLLR